LTNWWSHVQAQSAYFQQQVNYKIVARLDDQQHTLTGNIEIEYTNHAPKPLREIWMHLWGNAFKSNNSAFCKQKLRDGNTAFYFAPEADRGSYQALDFTVNQQPVKWCFDTEHTDIAQIELTNPLQPGATITIRTPFSLKIPASFSRLGHVETSYQMTQWFPKPAVYDQYGWHAMPYLDMGEFYSEFGNFDVSITLPENYVVGATGVLQTESEIDFLNKKVAETLASLQKTVKLQADTFPISSHRFKTIRYTAQNVHDFAWFADKRFLVIHDSVQLATGKKVDCWAMFTPSDLPLWKDAAFFVGRSVKFYSDHVGAYPWPQATAVHSALSAGGGMEYPMITVIGNEPDAKSLDEVITHEVGHNWFYGILATNERDHPFMDEGLNSYYEQRYMHEFYQDGFDLVGLPKWLYNSDKYGSVQESGIRLLDQEHTNIPPDTHSNLHTPISYGLMVYYKTAQCTQWLEKAVGTQAFDAAMQAYFNTWKFKHPYPNDLRIAWKNAGLEADWWFEAMQTRKQADYAISNVKKEGRTYAIEVTNHGDLNAPFPIAAIYQGKLKKTTWVSSSPQKRQTIQLDTDSVDAFVLDDARITIDPNRQNNTWNTTSMLHRVEPLTIHPFSFFQVKQKTALGLLPWIGYNRYDKIMLGLMAYNPPGANGRWQYYVAPAYGWGSKQLAGLADVRYHFFPGGRVPKVTLSMNAKQFSNASNASTDLGRYSESFQYKLKYQRLAPQMRVELRSKVAAFRHQLILRALFIRQETALFQRDSNKFDLTPLGNGQFDTLYNYSRFEGLQGKNSHIYELRYEAAAKKGPNPYRCVVALEARPQNAGKNGYLRSTMEWNQKFYYKKNKNITARMFAGAFLINANRDGAIDETALALNPQGFNDYRFDQLFFGRSETQGLVARQVSQTDGGFKAAFGKAQAGNIGNSNSFILALNLKADLPQRLPFGIPLKPWFDLGYFDDATKIGANRPRKEQILWSGGFMLEILKGTMEIYFPLVNAPVLRQQYAETSGGKNKSALFSGGNYLKWISWSIRLPFRDPDAALESFLR